MTQPCKAASSAEQITAVQVRRWRRLRDIFAVVWIVGTVAASFVSPAFAVGSAFGWAVAGLTATAFVGMLEEQRKDGAS